MKTEEVLNTNWGTLVELLLFVIISVLPVQVGIKILLLIAIYIISVKKRHIKLADIGISKSDIKLMIFIAGVMIAGIYQLIFYFIIDPVINPLLPPIDIQALGIAKGDVQQLITWVLISWAFAAIFEEVLFRGYLVNRFTGLLGNSLWSKIIIVIVAGATFGFVHSYQGIHGIISAGIFGLFQCIIFFLNKRRLFMLMVIHGTFDTISFILLFLGIN